MKLSSDTLAVLANFATINNGLQVKPGNKIGTISPGKSILAEAEVSEMFDQEFCIYDLGQFLGALSLFDDPELDFQENRVVISGGDTHIKYTYAEPKTIVTVPDKKLSCNKDVQFTLTPDILKQVFKASAVLALPNLVFEKNSVDGEIVVTATDIKDPTSNEVRIVLDSSKCQIVPDDFFRVVFKLENIKIHLKETDYDIVIDKNGIAQFSTEGLTYFIAVDKADSTF